MENLQASRALRRGTIASLSSLPPRSSVSPMLLRGGGRALQFGAARKSTQPETDATRMARERNALDRLDVQPPRAALSCESAEPAKCERISCLRWQVKAREVGGLFQASSSRTIASASPSGGSSQAPAQAGISTNSITSSFL